MDRFDKYSDDRKIHVVAAPGSGKTTLGIELVRRLDSVALILAPTITIREQWAERIQESFLPQDNDILESSDPLSASAAPDPLAASGSSLQLLSQDLKNPGIITIATYQALHSAMNRISGVLEEDDELHTSETVDYSDFDLVKKFQEQKLSTLCLDECHHLRSEWWKALEQFKSAFPQIFTVALTATPPYDSTPAMWTRYMDMCGSIDEEITVPELVKDGTLCPHQDYVYFNYPTKEEMKRLEVFNADVKEITDMLLADETFFQAVQGHALLAPGSSDEKILDNPAFFSSLLIFLAAKKVPCPERFQKLLGFRRLEELSPKWMELLMQGFFFDDPDSFAVDTVYREQLLHLFKSKGLIEKRKVLFCQNPALEKMMVNSMGKCDSIREITFAEYDSMQKDLRLLILTDYIRKEYESSLGDETKHVEQLGVLPFFEQLRRHAVRINSGIRFAVLCGSVVIIPAEAKNALLSIAEEPDRISFSSAGLLTDYVKVNISGDRHFMTGLVSRLFAEGYFQALIGTKSLLGEGWDSPCINALILASFVGSYMLSNQMRGRAIRIFKDEPDKTSNIWHLVCVRPRKNLLDPYDMGDSEDFAMLSRRMEHFLGLHYEEDSIENGMDRLSFVKPPFSPENVRKINVRMLELSRKRSLLKERWERSLAVFDRIETVDETGVQDKFIPNVLLFDAIRNMIISTILMIIAAIFAVNLCIRTGSGSVIGLTFGIFSILLFFIERPLFKKVFSLGTPLGRLEQFGRGIRSALLKTGQLEMEESRVEAESAGALYQIYLLGGTGRDKALFAKCIFEFFEVIDNQRYLLYKSSRKNKLDGCFVIPDCFARRREDADIFAKEMERFIGKYEVVYTRNAEGRKILLDARVTALANKEEALHFPQEGKGRAGINKAPPHMLPCQRCTTGCTKKYCLKIRTKMKISTC